MQIDPQTLDSTAVYKLLISSVVPRPIAWVSSLDTAGVGNLAPFSYFMAITAEPPTIAFACSPREGAKKDTLRNVEAAGEFVVNVVDDERAEQMNLSSGDYAPDVDEFVLTGLTAAPSVKVKPPRVAERRSAWNARSAASCPSARRIWSSARSSSGTCATTSTTRPRAGSTCTACVPSAA